MDDEKMMLSSAKEASCFGEERSRCRQKLVICLSNSTWLLETVFMIDCAPEEVQFLTEIAIERRGIRVQTFLRQPGLRHFRRSSALISRSCWYVRMLLLGELAFYH